MAKAKNQKPPKVKEPEKEVIDPKVLMMMGMMKQQKEPEKSKQRGIYSAMNQMVIDRR